MNAAGKVIIVTGSNAGIGKATALSLARLGAAVVIVCRNVAAGEAVRQELSRRPGIPPSI
jgi:NAD(P)-dependent dehydrogenase (short-subunit alcohol dehydrogenase family)